MLENPLATKLTKRELEVLGGLVAGQSNKETRFPLDLQEVTVKLHVKTPAEDQRPHRTHAANHREGRGVVLIVSLSSAQQRTFGLRWVVRV